MVSDRNARYRRSGSGKGGQRRHHRAGTNARAVGQSRGRVRRRAIVGSARPAGAKARLPSTQPPGRVEGSGGAIMVPGHTGPPRDLSATAAAPIRGPDSPSRLETIRHREENDNLDLAAISSPAASRNGRPNPSATDPETVARGRSSRLATSETPRPTRRPVRATISGVAVEAGFPVTARIAVPDASASRQPLAPHTHLRPSGSTMR
jgi:hypothetical protein